MGEFDAAIKEFLVESDENLSQVEQDLVSLEGHPEQEDIIASIFRSIHTIKGTCSFLGFGKLEKLAHTGETLLSMVRDGELPLIPDITTALLSMVDAIRQMLESIETTGEDGQEEFTALIQRLTTLQSSEASESTPNVALAAEDSTTPTETMASPAPSVDSVQEESEPVFVQEEILDSSGELPQPAKSSDQPKYPQEGKGPAAAEATIRVDVHLLDKLMNMVGELVLTRNQILQWTSSQEDHSINASSQRLNLITSELQEGIMKTRMQPIGNVFSKFPRVVRDLALTCGKEVHIEMEGQDTELDKTLLEAIKDPLTHLVRNSVDHGLERPEVRKASGKPEEGRLLLRAYHEGGQVNIEITDDGAGINPDKITQTAIKRGVITADQAARMNERELQNLIFLPGFSTAEKVTNVSGRGVGMDVVKTNIEKIGGAIDLQSRVGEGTTIKVKVPLTLAIIPALVVTTGDERFAIPQVSLLELVRLEGDQIKKIENVHGSPVYRLRGKLLPIVYLNEILKINAPELVKEEPEETDVINIVVLQADDQRFGLVVEDINDTEEIVVKPLSKQLKSIPVYAGATIMGDGHVALILDVLNLATQAGLAIKEGEHVNAEDASVAKGSHTHKETLLLVQAGRKGRLAIPLRMVARLEEIKASTLESAGDQEVIQYRNEILPLVRLRQILGVSGNPAEMEEEFLQLAVLSEEGRQVGLVVDRIVDIVEEELVAQSRSTQPGVLYSAVIQHHVTDVLDVSTVFEQSRLSSMHTEPRELVEA